MKNYKHLDEYTTLEINDYLNALRSIYDHVQLVDVEECRVLEAQPDGTLQYGRECYRLWGRQMRCAHCSGYQACMTHHVQEKTERVNGHTYEVVSKPIYLELLDGELELCVLDCAKISRKDAVADANDGPVYLSTHDVLTRLYTQDKLYSKIRQKLIEQPNREWLLVEGNIRDFKLINKLFGIEGGNQVLIGVAEMLRNSCTDEEVYGRYRDDRFIVLIGRDRFSEEMVLRAMEPLKHLLESPIYSVHVQLGVYALRDVNMPISTMLDHTEMALHTIEKSRQKTFAYYAEGMMERKLRDQQIITEFEKNLHDLHIFLQPQVLEDGRIVGAEALARWIRPNGSVVPPGDFIPVLHQSDMLSYMDRYIWELAIMTLRAWQGTPLEGLYISINVDPSDFFYMDVTTTLAALCAKHGVDPKLLRVEITETALANESEKQNDLVEKLQAAGFTVEIDDFGKGSSSLSMLKDVHADVLKIDMGFISGKENRHRSKVILDSVIDMAGQLNMEVIAEGVETRVQVEELAALGCSYFQGYYFSRPIPVEDFEMVVRHRVQ